MEDFVWKWCKKSDIWPMLWNKGREKNKKDIFVLPESFGSHLTV